MTKIVLLFYIVCFIKADGLYLRQLETTEQTQRQPKRLPPTTRVRVSRDPLIDPRDRYYLHPNFGYEPYWANGLWHLGDHNQGGNKSRTTKIPLVCGEECEFIYLKLGKCCGHRSDQWNFYGCSGQECYGEFLKNMTVRYKTFNTYCQFLNEQCRQPFDSKWIFLYMGPCITDQDSYLKPIVNPTIRVNRMQKYISDFGFKYNIPMKITKPRTTIRAG